MTAAWWTKRRILLATLLVALALRCVAAAPTTFHHPDELWQYLEPAYHLAVGPWVVAWEMREGIRTWLIPVALAGPMAAGHALDPHGTLHLLLPRLMLVVLSLSVVWSAAVLGFRLSRLHGLLAGFVAAVWFELVFFAPRALSEPVALALLMLAAPLLIGERTPPRTAWAGLLLGLSFCARFQYAPALGVLAIGTVGLDWRRGWLPLVAGGLAALAIDGAIDLANDNVPLRWITENFRINLIEHKSDQFGTEPAWWYLLWIGHLWSVAIVPVVLLAIRGARRYPVLLWVALAHLAAHSLIPHKEYRFLLPTTALLVVLAAIGTGDLVAKARRRQLAAGLALAGWAATSAALAAAPDFRVNWRSFNNIAGALAAAGRPAKTCGLIVYREDFVLSAAYAIYNRATPIYVAPDRPGALAAAAQTADVVVAPYVARSEIPASYRLEMCGRDLRPGAPPPAFCVYRRSGGCTGPAPAAWEINRVAARKGE